MAWSSRRAAASAAENTTVVRWSNIPFPAPACSEYTTESPTWAMSATANPRAVPQPEELRVRHLARDLARRLDGERKRAHEKALRRREFRIGNHVRPYPVDLMQQLDQRAVRHVGAHLGGRLPVAQAAVPAERRVRAVRPALLLAQDEEQPGVGAAPEHLRSDTPGIIDRVGGQDGGVAGHDVRLC